MENQAFFDRTKARIVEKTMHFGPRGCWKWIRVTLGSVKVKDGKIRVQLLNISARKRENGFSLIETLPKSL